MKQKIPKITSVAFLALCASAQAASISFNAVAATSGGMSASDTAGVNGAANWNNLNSVTVAATTDPVTPGDPTIAGNLAAGSVKDSSGTVLATTTVTWSGSGQANSGSGSGTNDNRMFVTEWDLFNVGTNNSGNAMTITVTNIPYAVYDVYYYVQDAQNASDRGGDVDANGTLESIMMFNYPSGGTGVVPPTSTSYVEANSAFTYSSSTDRGTYLRLENITGSTLTLGIDGKKPLGTDIERLRMSGFQIVQVPEPSAALLALLGSLGLVFSRRRA